MTLQRAMLLLLRETLTLYQRGGKQQRHEKLTLYRVLRRRPFAGDLPLRRLWPFAGDWLLGRRPFAGDCLRRRRPFAGDRVQGYSGDSDRLTVPIYNAHLLRLESGM